MTAKVAVRKRDAEKVLAAVREQFAGWISEGDEGPVLMKDYDFLGWGSSPYAILWEGGPYEWTFIAINGGTEQEFGAAIKPVTLPDAVWTEPVTSFILGIYAA